MTSGVPRLRPFLVVVAAAAIVAVGCDSIYYRAMKKLGKEKRDILVGRVKDARASQAEAQTEFKSALERFQAIVQVEGGSLEDKYKKLDDELRRSEDRANKVKSRNRPAMKVRRNLPSAKEITLAEIKRAICSSAIPNR